MDFGSIPFIILFFSGLVSYILRNKHFLLILIRLEAIVLSIYILLFYYFAQFRSERFVNIIYLSLRVCEGALGLTLLVVLIRTHGTDIILMFDNL